jgi:glycosyltransferase involved in cell wall biosynthesis
MEIDFINGRKTDEIFGISKYSLELQKRLVSITFNTIEYPILARGHLVDGLTKRFLYPAIVRSRMKRGNIKHITNQDYAFLLTLFRIHPVVMTCHDLIPWTYYGQRSLFWRMNIKGLQKADEIITVSEFSKDQVQEVTGFPKENIHVVYNGVDHTQYYPNHDRQILSRYKIVNDDPVILFVGSEEPRKNLGLLLKAMVELKEDFRDLKLIKVGTPGLGNSRETTMQQIKNAGLQENVIFTGFVPEIELSKYYNAADLFIFPSLIEGFGLPPLEAMACGCPVISANTSSLPEVIGDGGLLTDPYDAHGLALLIEKILIDEQFSLELRERGIKRAANFSWERAAAETIDVYERLALSNGPPSKIRGLT